VTHLKTSLCLFVVSIAVSSHSLASSWVCRHGDLVRQLDVVYAQVPAAAPCMVVYRKPTENVQDRTLWEAKEDGDYCATKATGFIRKLESWGWDCADDPSGLVLATAPKSVPGDEPDYSRPEDLDSGDDYQPGFFVTVTEYLAFDSNARLAFVSGFVDSRLRMWRWDLLASGYSGVPPNQEFLDWRQQHVRRLDECVREHALSDLVRELDDHFSALEGQRGRDKHDESAATHLQAVLAGFCELHG
jgi:hypothetical protein